MRQRSPELILTTEQKHHRRKSQGQLEASIAFVGRRSKAEKMGLVDYSVFVWVTLAAHGYLMVKTDFFGGRWDMFGVRVRRGPHRKPVTD